MKILIATDGSPSAGLAVELVAALRWPAGSAFRIVSVVPRNANLGMTWSPERPDVEELDRYRDPDVRSHAVALADAERELAAAQPGARIDRFLLRGRAASLIVQEARDFAADLVVVGHRGRGTIETMLLGSVSAEVVDHAPCAVLVARSAECAPVVFADDGSASARVAASVLEQLPLPPGTPVTVLTVSDDSFPYETAVSPGLYGEAMTMYEQSREEANRQANAVAAAAVARLDQAGFQANAIARSGDPAHEIVAHANEYRARLLVLGTRGHTGLRRLMLGSVARNVLLHAPCSVLVVRENVAPPADGDELVHLAMSER